MLIKLKKKNYERRKEEKRREEDAESRSIAGEW
jgi:hypothetical protein